MRWQKPEVELLSVGMEIGAYRSPNPPQRPRPPFDEEPVPAIGPRRRRPGPLEGTE